MWLPVLCVVYCYGAGRIHLFASVLQAASSTEIEQKAPQLRNQRSLLLAAASGATTGPQGRAAGVCARAEGLAAQESKPQERAFSLIRVSPGGRPAPRLI